MKRDIAERIAATEVEGISVRTAREVIRSFLTELARCPVCDGGGTFRFRREVVVWTTDADRRPSRAQDQVVEAGTVGSCPYCGSVEEELSGKGDPEYVTWCCVRGSSNRDCRAAKDGDDGDRHRGHRECGWRIMLPLPGTGAGP